MTWDDLAPMASFCLFPHTMQHHYYDCGAAVLVMGCRVVRGLRMGRGEAIELTGCKPFGVGSLKLRACFRRCGVHVSGIALRNKVRLGLQALHNSKCLVIHSNVGYDVGHWMLMAPYDDSHAVLGDPSRLKHRVVDIRKQLRTADCVFALSV